MDINGREALGWALVAGCFGAIAWAMKVTNDLRRVERKLDKSIDEIVYAEKIDIPQSTINKAIERHVDTEVRYQVEKAANKAAKEVVDSHKNEIKRVVDDEFQKQKADVAKNLKRRIDNIDISEIKQDVIKEASIEAKEKFRKDFDNLMEKHAEELEDKLRIYSSIADRIENIGS